MCLNSCLTDFGRTQTSIAYSFFSVKTQGGKVYTKKIKRKIFIEGGSFDTKRTWYDMRSTRTKKLTLYLQEANCDRGAGDDPETFSRANSDSKSKLWYHSMKNEMDSMIAIKFGNLLTCLKARRLLTLSVFSRPKEIH